ncbi:Cloroperoxidase [Sphaerulina musiva SO2202]|uniref:Cloroperoxidase n=1 Tax=Sphaerulina musiva (strain SO2202) TaxID=692275 RepID=M3AUS4_SPHMS|nr:Cloroperoxidase [Sphaerulina musiva SO2202]EMF09816.1 Cloroperoxidase [Sphaerulina musiva SO2202]
MDPVEMAERDALVVRQAPGSNVCPFNPDHRGAVPFNPKYPYCGAQNGAPGFQICANNRVPARGDTAHAYQAPGPNDIRGPCPGLNTAANHGFLSRDGIVTFAELTDAQQNVYGVGYDLAVLLAVLGVGLDGDPITTKLSLGCDATSRTATPGLGPEGGLSTHNKFEGDTSLTRNDFYLANGDNFRFNRTLYNMMSQTTGGENIALYRFQRYQQSLNENGNFYFGPKSVLLFGAASFLYELFPSFGGFGTPDQTTMDFFFIKEQLPPNWFSRVDPYTIPLIAAEIAAQYFLHPVAFGGNTGKPNTFVGVGTQGPYISNNTIPGSPAGVACLLYQIATENIPSAIGGGGAANDAIPASSLNFMRNTLNPLFTNSSLSGAAAFGCPIVTGTAS